MRLSKRLQLVASFVPFGSRAADVGTDHGYVPIYLVENNICPGAVALDVGKGPLGRAESHIREHGLSDRIKVRLSDGMEKLKPGEADTVVMAGMGGQLVLHILDGGRHMWGSVGAFVLSPQSELDKVRRYLWENSFFIVKEAMTEEEGKYYTVMLARRSDGGKALMEKSTYEKRHWLLYGKKLIEGKDPVLARFLEKEERRLKGLLQGFEGQQTPGAAAARKELGGQLFWVLKAREEMGILPVIPRFPAEGAADVPALFH